jgi:hypothetical protein
MDTTRAASVVKPRKTERSTALLLLQVFTWLVTLLPSRLVFGPLGAFGSPAYIAGLAAFGLWASGAVRPGLLPRTVVPVRVAVLGIWIPSLIAYGVLHLNAVPGDEVNGADRWILFMMVWSGVALLAAEGLRDTDDVFRLLRVVVAGAAAVSLIALVQSRTGFDVTVWMARIPGLTVNGDLQSVVQRSGRARAGGTTLHPLELGTVLAMSLGPAMALAQSDHGWARRRRVGALCLIAFGIPTSISRSAVLGTIIVLLFWFAVADAKTRLRGGAAVLGVLTVLFLTAPGFLGTFRGYFVNAGNDASITTRTDDYAAVAPFIRHSPWIGRGQGTFLPKFRVLDNQWLGTLIGAGIIGAVGMLIMFLGLMYLGGAIRRVSSSQLNRSLGQALMGASAVVIFACTTYDLLNFLMSAAFFFLFLGIAGGLYGSALESRRTLESQLRLTGVNQSSARYDVTPALVHEV